MLSVLIVTCQHHLNFFAIFNLDFCLPLSWIRGVEIPGNQFSVPLLWAGSKSGQSQEQGGEGSVWATLAGNPFARKDHACKALRHHRRPDHNFFKSRKVVLENHTSKIFASFFYSWTGFLYWVLRKKKKKKASRFYWICGYFLNDHLIVDPNYFLLQKNKNMCGFHEISSHPSTYSCENDLSIEDLI